MTTCSCRFASQDRVEFKNSNFKDASHLKDTIIKSVLELNPFGRVNFMECMEQHGKLLHFAPLINLKKMQIQSFLNKPLYTKTNINFSMLLCHQGHLQECAPHILRLWGRERGERGLHRRPVGAFFEDFVRGDGWSLSKTCHKIDQNISEREVLIGWDSTLKSLEFKQSHQFRCLWVRKFERNTLKAFRFRCRHPGIGISLEDASCFGILYWCRQECITMAWWNYIHARHFWISKAWRFCAATQPWKALKSRSIPCKKCFPTILDLLQMTFFGGQNPVTGADTFLSAGCDIADAGSYSSRWWICYNMLYVVLLFWTKMWIAFGHIFVVFRFFGSTGLGKNFRGTCSGRPRQFSMPTIGIYLDRI